LSSLMPDCGMKRLTTPSPATPAPCEAGRCPRNRSSAQTPLEANLLASRKAWDQPILATILGLVAKMERKFSR
jgi:hypothetical protein